MRIRSYLALLVFACLLGAYTMEQVLAYRFTSVQILAEKHNESLLWAKDLQRIENTASQYLISSDLVIGSGNTYLIFGAKNIGDSLANELAIIEASNQFPSLKPKIQEAQSSVSNINKILDTIADIPSNKLEQSLSKLLIEYDPVSLKLSRNIQILSKETSTFIQQESLFLSEQKQGMKQISWITRLVFFLLIIILWWWANYRICKPLNGLVKSSNGVLSGHRFDAPDKAPKEIIELSNDFKHLTENLFHQASHDPLTELKNRRAFEFNLNRIIEDREYCYFLCFVDLDYFKTINDTCGHAAGDDILIKVASILNNSVSQKDIAARLGGDEFAILIKDSSINNALETAHKIREGIHSLTYHHDGDTLHLSASIGIAQKQNNTTTTELLHSADVACSLAKSEGRNTVHVYDKSDEKGTIEQIDILPIHQVNNALDNNHFVLYKQDIIALQSDSTGQYFEILLRMKSTDGKIISPAKFFPTIERYRLSSRVDIWVINAVFQHFFTHQEHLQNVYKVSINISGHSMNDGELERFLVDKIENGHIPPEKLNFEITETVAITNMKHARSFIDKVNSLGCSFALNDFGSGHSSFTNLKELPTQTLKINGSIISNMMDNSLDYIAVKSICDLAKAANQDVIAKYVEDEATKDALQQLGVNYAQGYYFSKPTELR
ncbi:EAL domain-containing protein [Paraglaciecola sp.]|uniref:putative bifunctional diguanylate cyclase/phosphodiesterase n=1 Tax=Paraglaciecola sp. TaxID=1920173 RepID=UPI003263EED7